MTLNSRKLDHYHAEKKLGKSTAELRDVFDARIGQKPIGSSDLMADLGGVVTEDVSQDSKCGFLCRVEDKPGHQLVPSLASAQSVGREVLSQV
jgi:hypothetical protein